MVEVLHPSWQEGEEDTAMSKGSKRRPQQIEDSKMAENWEKIFGKGTADRKAMEAVRELSAEIHDNLGKIVKPTIH